MLRLATAIGLLCATVASGAHLVRPLEIAYETIRSFFAPVKGGSSVHRPDELDLYFYKMETATFPEPLTDELIKALICPDCDGFVVDDDGVCETCNGKGVTRSAGFRFRNGQDLKGKVTSLLSKFIQHIHTLDQLQLDKHKIQKAINQYNQIPGFQEDLDMIKICLETRPMQIQAGLDGNISAMLKHMRNYNSLNYPTLSQDPTGEESFHAYLRDNETRVNGLCKGDAEQFLKQHRNMGFIECWNKAKIKFLAERDANQILDEDSYLEWTELLMHF